MNVINYSIIIPHYNIPDLLMRCLKGHHLIILTTSNQSTAFSSNTTTMMWCICIPVRKTTISSSVLQNGAFLFALHIHIIQDSNRAIHSLSLMEIC